MNAELIPFLLKLLEDPLSECDKPSATKALIAESLKNMAKDLANGERVRTTSKIYYEAQNKIVTAYISGIVWAMYVYVYWYRFCKCTYMYVYIVALYTSEPKLRTM